MSTKKKFKPLFLLLVIALLLAVVPFAAQRARYSLYPKKYSEYVGLTLRNMELMSVMFTPLSAQKADLIPKQSPT